MTKIEPCVGKVVESKAGRDSGKVFAVIKIINEQFVMVADGKTRKLNAPKMKKWKHLRPFDVVLEVIAEKFKEGKKVFDSELNSALRAVVAEREQAKEQKEQLEKKEYQEKTQEQQQIQKGGQNG